MPRKKGDKKVPAVLNFKMKDIDGKDVDLSKYQGKVVLFVNVASKCGYTPQYKGLEALHEKYAKDGLVIIGVPANEFGKQEPGTDAEIKSSARRTTTSSSRCCPRSSSRATAQRRCTST